MNKNPSSILTKMPTPKQLDPSYHINEKPHCQNLLIVIVCSPLYSSLLCKAMTETPQTSLFDIGNATRRRSILGLQYSDHSGNTSCISSEQQPKECPYPSFPSYIVALARNLLPFLSS